MVYELESAKNCKNLSTRYLSFFVRKLWPKLIYNIDPSAAAA
jgi:hypothetical protein